MTDGILHKNSQLQLQHGLNRVDMTHMRTSTERAPLAYGRRKFIPLLVVTGVLGLAWALGADAAGGRLVGVGVLAWSVVFGWRYWADPMPARLEARLQRVNPDDSRFGSKRWHKVAIGTLLGLVLLFAALVAAASL